MSTIYLFAGLIYIYGIKLQKSISLGEHAAFISDWRKRDLTVVTQVHTDTAEEN